MIRTVMAYTNNSKNGTHYMSTTSPCGPTAFLPHEAHCFMVLRASGATSIIQVSWISDLAMMVRLLCNVSCKRVCPCMKSSLRLVSQNSFDVSPKHQVEEIITTCRKKVKKVTGK